MDGKIQELKKKIHKERITKKTNFNPASSRSHLFTRLTLHREETSSSIFLCDFAGKEEVESVSSDSTIKEEGRFINKTLDNFAKDYTSKKNDQYPYDEGPALLGNNVMKRLLQPIFKKPPRGKDKAQLLLTLCLYPYISTVPMSDQEEKNKYEEQKGKMKLNHKVIESFGTSYNNMFKALPQRFVSSQSLSR